MSLQDSPISCDLKDLTPEDFLRRFVRVDQNGNYALAVIDVTSVGTWSPITCGNNITWQDIVALIAGYTADGKFAVNTVTVS